jgi:hypothetical protein
MTIRCQSGQSSVRGRRVPGNYQLKNNTVAKSSSSLYEKTPTHDHLAS